MHKKLMATHDAFGQIKATCIYGGFTALCPPPFSVTLNPCTGISRGGSTRRVVRQRETCGER